MKIQLPIDFEYCIDGKLCAYIKNEILYIRSPIKFEDIMYALTYKLKENKQCSYCGKVLSTSKRTVCTLDHVYPRSLGGISIPDNLVPACSKCNREKSGLLPQQYQTVKQLATTAEQNEAIEYFTKQNELQKKEKGILIPEDWYQRRKNYYVYGSFMPEHSVRTRGYRHVRHQYRTYGQICKPVVISNNHFVLDGLSVLLLCKTVDICKPVPFIILENVFVKI